MNNVETEFSIVIRNAEKFAKGEIIEEWLDLPATEKQMRYIFMKIGLSSKENICNYEYSITNYDEYPFYRIQESDDLRVLNTLAKQLSMLGDKQHSALIYYADHKDIYKNEDLVTLSLHADELPYFPYDHDIMQSDVIEEISLEERYGMTKAIDNGLMDKLDELHIINHFDFEDYGHSDILNGDVALYEEGYIDNKIKIPIPEDLEKACTLIIQNYEKHSTISEINPVRAERLKSNIEKLIQHDSDLQQFSYDYSMDTGNLLYKDQQIVIRLSDVLERRNGFENFMQLQRGETNDECLDRSIKQLLIAKNHEIYEEQELVIDSELEARKPDMMIGDML